MKYNRLISATACALLFAGCAQYREDFAGARPISFRQLTPAAQATVRKEIGNQPIAAITQEWKYGGTSYRIEVERKGINPTLWVASDGYIIKESRRLVGYNQQFNEAAGAQNSYSRKSMQQTNQSSRPTY
jgi:hypothetical protein